MRIHFAPQRRDDALTLTRAGDALTINGLVVDLAALEPGEVLQADPWPSEFLVGAGRATASEEWPEGEVWFEVLLPTGANPSEAVRNPAALTDVAEGPIAVPADPPAPVEPAPPPEPEPDPEPADLLAAFEQAIQFHVDMQARSRRYADGVSLASYVTSTIPAWATEAAVFVAWRDAVWLYAYQELEKVEAAEREVPAIDAFLGELPAIVWPGEE